MSAGGSHDSREADTQAQRPERHLAQLGAGAPPSGEQTPNPNGRPSPPPARVLPKSYSASSKSEPDSRIDT